MVPFLNKKYEIFGKIFGIGFIKKKDFTDLLFI